MNADEFYQIIDEMLRALTEEDKKKFNCFIMIVDRETNLVKSIGTGCPACQAEYIVEALENGEFKHLKDDRKDDRKDDKRRFVH